MRLIEMTNKLSKLVFIFGAIFLMVHLSERTKAAERPFDLKKPFAIEELKPGIFRTQQGPYFGIVLEGERHLLVFDTLSKAYANWLDQELQKRFPGKPVKFVVYSHNHTDHITGGQAFAHHNPLYISHRLAKESMVRMGVDTAYPSLTFDRSLQIDLDGRMVELTYWGANDGVGSISLYVPSQKFISVIDWALTTRVAYKDLARYDVEGMIRSLHAIDQLDWDLISPGHASTGSKEEMRIFRQYLETIRAGVISGIKDGETKEPIIQKVMTELRANPKFSSLKKFEDWAEMNVRGVYRQIAKVEGVGE